VPLNGINVKKSLIILPLILLSCVCTSNANENKIETKFEYVAPYAGSIRDVYPFLAIELYQTDYFSYTESVEGDGYGGAYKYLFEEQKDKALKMCRRLKGKHETIFYGIDNISVSERQLTDITINYSGGTSYKTGQKVHIMFNMYCAKS